MADEELADIVKIACRIEKNEDSFLVLDLLKNPPKRVIAIGMGPLGVNTRLLSRKFDAELTFGTLDLEKSSATGSAQRCGNERAVQLG